MAENKKTQDITPETQDTAPAGTVAKTPTENTEEKLVPVFISKQSRNDTERFIAVNGERILVQTGKTVEIPERFAEVIRNSEKMSADAEKYIEDNISKS